jgi:hypothetical protein
MMILTIALALLSLIFMVGFFWQRKQIEALFALKTLEGCQIVDRPAWQISSRTGSRVAGLLCLVAACGIGAIVYWAIGPMTAVVIQNIKIGVGIVGGIITLFLIFFAIFGLFGAFE